MTGLLKILANAAILLLSIRITNAQVIGSDLCSCSPTIFRFEIDLAGTCQGSNLAADDAGIDNVECEVFAATTDAVADLTPLAVDSIAVQELNEDSVINSAVIPLPANNDFESISATVELTPVIFPFSLRLTLNGVNADGVRLFNIIKIDYDASACDDWPWYPVGSKVGWVEFVRSFRCRTFALRYLYQSHLFFLYV